MWPMLFVHTYFSVEKAPCQIEFRLDLFCRGAPQKCGPGVGQGVTLPSNHSSCYAWVCSGWHKPS
jgi:hypothetical protein